MKTISLTRMWLCVCYVLPFALSGVSEAASNKDSSSNGGGGGVMDAFMGNMLQGRKLTPELEYFDMERRRKLYSIPKGGVIHNLWTPGEAFNLYIFLSTSAAPLKQFPLSDKDFTQSADPSGEQSFPLVTQSTWGSLAASEKEEEEEGRSAGLLIGGIQKLWTLIRGNSESSQQHQEEGTETKERGTSRENAVVWDNFHCRNQSARTSMQPNVDVSLLFFQQYLTYDWNTDNERQLFVNVTLPECIRKQNVSMYAHIYAVGQGVSPDPKSETYQPEKVVSYVEPLITHRPKIKIKDTRNLLGDSQQEDGDTGTPRKKSENLLTKWFGVTFGDDNAQEESTQESAPAADSDASHEKESIDQEFDDTSDYAMENDDEEGEEEQPIVRYWKPSLHTHLLYDLSKFKVGQIPPFYPDYLQVIPSKRGYLPVLYANEFWILTESLVPVNESSSVVPFEIHYNTMSSWKWQIQLQMQNSWDLHAQWGTQGEKETDQIKSMIMDTNPILLVITLVVSTLHMLFDFLAFKNDISFWHNTKTMKGLSLRSITLNLFFQVVIFLYLLDNDTSWMILMSSGVGLLIEVWKLRKAVSVTLEWKEGNLPTFNWSNKDEGYVKSDTKKYDDIAMQHLSYAIYPLIVGYAIYSLIYEKHRGWYSWILSSLTGFVYAFGFILMTPQLFINYKMKSVAHLPWRAMVYKSLNTFIDDLFAFVIKMPTMHRLSCFRDDIIFFIYLYQRWIYPVDKSRRNEFGASAEDYENMEARRKGIRKVKRSKYERRYPDSTKRDSPLLKTSS